MLDQYKRRFLLEKVVSKLKQDGKIVSVQVSDAEVAAEFNRSKEFLPPKPPMVTFKQIVMALQPSRRGEGSGARAARSRSSCASRRAPISSKRRKRESMDPLTKESGGDLGWARRGDNVPEFDRWLFGGPFLAPLAPGQLSAGLRDGASGSTSCASIACRRARSSRTRSSSCRPDRLQRRRAHGASSPTAWPTGCAHGVAFDTLAKKFHDYAGKEETSMLTPWVRDSLAAYVSEGLRHDEGRRRRRRSRFPARRSAPTFQSSSSRNCSRRTRAVRRRSPRCSSPPCAAISPNAAAFAATSTSSRSRRSWPFGTTR